MWVIIDRDGLALPTDERPQARRYELQEIEDLYTTLLRVGIPLHFTDGHGIWIVSIGFGERGPVPVAVVRQVPDGAGSKAEVLFVTPTPIGELLSDDGNLRLYYSSVPGPAADVLDAAKQGKFRVQSDRGLVDNLALRGAVATFSAKPGQKTMLEVLRQSLGGLALLDITGSEPGTMTILSGSGLDGSPALFAFTNQEQVGKFHRQRGNNIPTRTLGVPADSLPQMVLDKPDTHWLYIDPAGPTCALTREDQIGRLFCDHGAIQDLASLRTVEAGCTVRGDLVACETATIALWWRTRRRAGCGAWILCVGRGRTGDDRDHGCQESEGQQPKSAVHGAPKSATSHEPFLNRAYIT